MDGHDDYFYTRPEGLPDRIGAGGVVVRVEDGQVLVALIKEVEVGDAHYVLPKGGIEPGETIGEASLREIREEAGLTQVTRLAHLDTRCRVAYKRDHWQTSHYGLYITTQIDGQIVDVENHHSFGWFPIDDLPPLFWRDELEIIAANRERIVALALGHLS